MMSRFCIYILLLFATAGIHAQSSITFVNSGALYVKDSLYIKGDFHAKDQSSINQKGTTALTGNFTNEITSGNVFATGANSSTGTFEFCGTAPQHITSAVSKERYVNFPDTLRINNAKTVVMQSQVAATAKVVDIRDGRLILDSDAKDNPNTLVNAHLLIEKDVITHPNAVQVNLALGDNYKNKKLVGFTPPFEKMYADYFFFNFLSRPSSKGLFGNSGRLITNPRTLLSPGLGYIIGMGIIPDGDPYYTTELDPRWSKADYTKRATAKFSFSRAVAEPSFSQYLSDQTAPGYITGEKLLTKDVEDINLEKGFNYLGNPYMAPLDLSDIVAGTTSADWGVPDNTLKKGFYILSEGTGSYAGGKFTFSASYLIRQEQGSTHNTSSVAPMQMFIVGTDKPVSVKIPAKKRSHSPAATFLRSTGYEITDELLIETTDNETGAFDRLCIVFRNSASLQSADPFDAVKIFNRSGGVNQIYTRSSDNKDMTVSVIPPATEQLPLYFMPALLPQQVTLKADRLNSLVSVGYVILEDTKTRTLTDLLRTPSYTFTSAPSDKPDRFVLHFTSNPTTGTDRINTPAATPSAVYEGGLIRVYGLRENSAGSEISLFDMQGKLIHRQPVQETDPCMIRKYLARGVYMVKNNTTVIKFAVK